LLREDRFLEYYIVKELWCLRAVITVFTSLGGEYGQYGPQYNGQTAAYDMQYDGNTMMYTGPTTYFNRGQNLAQQAGG